ncbi:sensor histidine kinase [Pedobacter puniceum]|uniref:GHKL domain-containing protein n=1 Tax=Pedobacter puniceum TaxID=2666136 RepID=A0A7K0FN71_9SPHI|nr:sensor histidine kinase [Pedobacter puniceum]MRX47252.1 GHKL domain-containing protein [Pedobacter puniceum]
MNEELKEKHFKPKAHILTLLGEELIKNPVMAIYELVKNSYDADANKVDVYFRDVDDLEKASIIVEDDGIGMTSEIVEDVWLEPGSDFRKPVNRDGIRETSKSPIFNRIPMGEKGVGRFAVHKLSTKILLISRPLLVKHDENAKEIISKELADYEIELFINWKDFNQSKHLSDIPIKWKLRKDSTTFRFKNTSGTYIHLSGLKETWTKGMARDLKGHTISMLSPKLSELNFRINLSFDNQWLTDFPSASSILDESPFKLYALIDDKYNLSFEYEFSLKNNTKIGSRKINGKENPTLYEKNIKGDIKPFIRKELEQKEYPKEQLEQILSDFDNEEKIPFGSLLFELNTFDLDSDSMRDYTNEPQVIKRILKDNSGIKVYKGDLRVFDYGEKGNDWLGIDLKRVQDPSWFSNNLVFGYVYLDSEKSSSLVEKTNREGFVENKSFLLFKHILDYILIQFQSERKKDRERWYRLNKKKTKLLFDDKINLFKKLLDDADLNNEEKKKRILEEAESIEKKYEEDKKILLIPAGVGMTASVALHEIEKLVPRMEETVKSIPLRKEVITNQVEELKQYTEGIISVLRKGGDKDIDIQESVHRAFNNYKLKLLDRKISYRIDIEDTIKTLKCDKRFFITVLMNLIDNSIYWLDTVYKESKEIYLKVLKEEESIIILIADNGPGFKDDISELIRPFFSRKADGIGIGLYLVDTIMLKYGKFDILNNNEEAYELGIPSNLDGAIVKLVFNKGQL